MSFFNYSDQMKEISEKALLNCSEKFSEIDRITEFNQQRVLKAFIDNGVSESHFAGSTGYGYGDRGREVLDEVTAQIFGAEDALIRHSFASGTHTLSVMLFGVLRPGDTVLCATGTPYDTIHSVIGLSGEGMGSLKDFGIGFEIIELKEDGTVDLEELKNKLNEKEYKAVYIQRSRGYSLRPTLTSKEIKEITDIVKANSKAITMLDNCYGEFTEYETPAEIGVDVFAGSLIKNPGGGIAKCGGYIAGKRDLVELCSYRLTTPGIGKEVGATLGNSRDIFMGLFHAPHVTGEALKTAVFTAAVFEEMGYWVSPTSSETRADIIQSIKLGNSEKLIAFCQGLQSGSVVDSYVVPEPWAMPGYDSDVIMAAGAFTNGSSIELSADAPLREPFAVWLQG
ncbi:MAG: methionine gamma-lyase family protein, partial [Acutalibacteraceae bacterium]|nr:methionine gamma-lyase family protein [Acutalibacteraceae bacterium]